VTEAAQLTTALVGFIRLLREQGLRTSPDAASRLQAAVGVLPADIVSLYWAGRVCLGVRQDFVPAYDAVFSEYFLGVGGGLAKQALSRGQYPALLPGAEQRRMQSATVPLAVNNEQSSGGEPDNTANAGSAASPTEVLRLSPFAACSPEELDMLILLIRRLRVRPPERHSRRWQPGQRREALDLRATARLAMKTQAEVLAPAWRQHRRMPRPIVMLLDVSRSMASHSRLYLHFGYALVAARPHVEVVCFGTQLTRITALLRSWDSAPSLEQAAMSVLDWNGGTRIAAAVEGLRTMPSIGATLRAAVVVIFSDGLERGNPADLGREMRLLRRSCQKIIWVNPLAGDERYQPLAGGMRAALPSVDQFMTGHTLAAMEELASILRKPSLARRNLRSRQRPLLSPQEDAGHLVPGSRENTHIRAHAPRRPATDH
jgi:uncharacterized protein